MLSGDVHPHPGPSGPWRGARRRQLRGGAQRGNGEHGLNVVVWNLNGVRSRYPALLTLAKELKPDVFLLQESRLTASVSTPGIPGYSAVRRDRRMGRDLRGDERPQGGLLIYVSSDLSYQCLPEPALPPNASLETLGVKIFTGGRPVSLLNFYRPPGRGGADQRDCGAFASRWPWGPNSIIAGDLNAEGSWSEKAPADRSNPAIGTEVEEEATANSAAVLNPTGLTTRIDRGMSSSPDVALASTDLLHRASLKSLDPAGSDHLPLLISLEGVRPKPAPRKARISLKSVDWEKFQERARRKLEAIRGEPNLEKKAVGISAALREALAEAAPTPKTHSAHAKGWWTAACEDARRDYVQLLRESQRHPGEDAHANAAVIAREQYNDVIHKAKRDSWRTFASSIDHRTKPGKIFGVLRALAGLRRSRPPNEVIVKRIPVEGGGERERVLCRDKEKADEAVRVYASVSRLRVPREESKAAYTEVRRAIRERCQEEEPEAAPITIEEFRRAAAKAKGKAPGPDGVYPELLRHLDEVSEEIILDYFNVSIQAAFVATIHKRATIIPILKSGKDPKDIKSFRPVSLTSPVAKTLESCLATRMAAWAEEKEVLPREQAGFRAGRSSEEAVAGLQALTFSGLNSPKPPLRSLTAAVDVQAAFDGLWSGGALRTAARAGLPGCWLKWLRSWLSDRRARVRWGDALSREKIFQEGAPQGSPLSPWWYSLGSSPLCSAVKEEAPEVRVTAFADDLTLTAQSHKLHLAGRLLQTALDALARAAEQLRLRIAPHKSQALLCSLHPRETIAVAPALSIAGTPIPYTKELKVLGVILDRESRSTAQAAAAKEKMAKRGRVLQALAGATWGPSPKMLRDLYFSFVRPSALHAAGSWFHYLSQTNRETLQRAETAMARVIVGAPKGSPVQATLREAGVKPTDLAAEEAGAHLAHRMGRFPPDHPAFLSTEPPATIRLGGQDAGKKRRAWAREAAEARARVTAAPPPPWKPYRVPSPWEKPKQILSYHTAGAGVSREEAAPVRLQAALLALHNLDNDPAGPGPPDVLIWSDGSAAEGGGGRGGGGALIKWKSGAEVLVREPAGELCSSTTAEAVALAAAMEKLRDDVAQLPEPPDPPDRPLRVRALFDSLALLQRLQRPAHTIDDPPTRRALSATYSLPPGTRVQFVWVPGHCGLPGNERADRAAKEAAELPQEGIPVELGAVKAALRAESERRWEERYLEATEEKGRLHREASEGGRPAPHLHLPLASARLLTALRLDRAPFLATTRARWGLVASPLCPHCSRGPETVLHWLAECPEWERPRAEHLPHREPLTVAILQSHPEEVTSYIRAVRSISADH